MALGYGPWCQDHPAVIKDQASPVSACHASGAAVADVLPRCEIGSRPAVPSPDGCRAVGLPHRHRMPAAALEKAFCQQEGGDHDAARTSVGFGPVSGPLHSRAHIRTAGARKSHVHP